MISPFCSASYRLIDFVLCVSALPKNLLQVTDSQASKTVVTNPTNIKDNGFWNVRKTVPKFGVEHAVEIELCMAGSGALSYLDYFACLSSS
jgi:hypothetical protein